MIQKLCRIYYIVLTYYPQKYIISIHTLFYNFTDSIIINSKSKFAVSKIGTQPNKLIYLIK